MTRQYRFPCGCTFNIIEEVTPEGVLPLLDFDPENIPENCPATYALLGTGLTKGIFQLESQLGKIWTKRLKPETDEHIGALGSILRPGSLRAVDADGVSMTQHYVRRKNGDEEVEPYHPVIDAILWPTFNCIIYQEQAMAVAVAVAGFTEVDADMLRKAMGKKLPAEMAKVKKLFLDGAEKTGVISTEQAQEVFGWIEKSQRYNFNKCFSQHTVIRRMSGNRGYTVGEMYRIRHDLQYAKSSGHEQLRRKWNRLGHYGNGLSMCDDGRVRPNIIRDILFSGLRKVYRITLEDNTFVDVTANHKLPTGDGIKTVSEMYVMGVYPSLVKCGVYEKTNFGKYKFSNVTVADLKVRKLEKKAVDGCFGESNWAYTNGSYTLFENNKKLLPLECRDCGKTKGRLEVHHVNGDRTNSSLDNLMRLCASCHKKREYAAGRTKIGEKGYPTFLCGIASIEYIGEEEVYDVVMDGPNHNLVTDNNIVACNSHAMSYGLTGYDSAWIKAHTPLAFFSGWLKNAKHKQDPLQEISELVNDARLFGVEVGPPDLRTLEPYFQTDRQSITFGLTDIKGVGEAQIVKVNNIIKEVEVQLDKPIAKWSWIEFLVLASNKISSGIISKLIQSGALRWFGLSRMRMQAEFNVWDSLTDKEKEFIQTCYPVIKGDLVSLLKPIAKTKKEGGACANKNRVSTVQSHVKLLENPPSPLVDTPNYLAWAEEQLLGISLTCSRVDSCDMLDVNCSCKEFMSGRTGFLLLGVEITHSKEIKTKAGRTPGSKMGRLTISDGTCSVDCVVFPDVWKEFGHLLTEKSLVIVQGERGKKDSNDLIVKKVWEAK